jgi:tetratricopeptide (TPR) repeat protein
MSGTRGALLVAATQYKDAELTRLRWPAADVTSLAEVLGNEAIGGFEVEEPVVNEPSHVVRHKIERFLLSPARQDVKLLYFSCHGVLSDDRRLHLAMPDTDTEWIGSTAVEDSFVHRMLQRSRARAKILILDCCHSGAFARGLPGKGSNERKIDVERLSGAGLVTLTASKEIEYAYEDGHFKELEGAPGGSVFTKIMVEGLRTGEADLNNDGVISIDELYEWTADRMREVTTRQQPGHSSFRRHGNVPIAWTRRSRLPAEIRARLEDRRSVHGRLWAIDSLRVMADDATPELAAEIREALTDASGDEDALVAASAEAALAGRPPPAPGVTPRDAPPPPLAKATSLMRRADEHRVARRFKLALDKYDEALAVSPDATNARVGRAMALLGMGLIDDSLEALDAAVEGDPTHVWARVSRAQLLLTLDRPSAAQLDVETALESEQDSAEALTIQGDVLAVRGHTKKAIEAYEQALEHDPDHLDALVGLGKALADLGDDARALAVVTRAIEIDDACVEARLAKARIHYGANKLRLGDAEVAEVLRLDSRNIHALLARGLAHLRREGRRTRDPLKDFDLALDIDPELPGALFGRAVLLKDRNPGAALEAIERIDLGRKAPGAWQPAAVDVKELEAAVLLDLGQPERALEAAEAGLAEPAAHPELYVLRARANFALGRPELVFADLDQIGGRYDEAAVEALRALALGSLMGRPRDAWPPDVTEDDVARSLHGDTLLAAELPGLSVDPMQLARKLRLGEDLLWYTACRYRNESFRRVALLLTSKQLVWAGRDEGAVAWRDVRDVRLLPPKGMRVVLHSGRRLEFPGISDDGVGFREEHASLDADGVRSLAARLTHEATATPA